MRPSGVTRGSSSSVLSPLLSEPSYIVRNLYIRNGISLRPSRGRINKIGPGEEILTATAIKIRGGDSTTRSSAATTLSRALIDVSLKRCVLLYTPLIVLRSTKKRNRRKPPATGKVRRATL